MTDTAGFLTLAIIVSRCFLTNKDDFFFFFNRSPQHQHLLSPVCVMSQHETYLSRFLFPFVMSLFVFIPDVSCTRG